MTRWLIRWLTAGYCEYYAAFFLLTEGPDRLGAANVDMEDFDG